jgi:hypothetical protein
MGVLAPGSAHARPSARPPIDVSGNFPARVSAEWPSKISKGKKQSNRLFLGGRGGGPEILFSMESSYFCELGGHAKFQIPSCCLYGRKVRASEERRRRKKNKLGLSCAKLRSSLVSQPVCLPLKQIRLSFI